MLALEARRASDCSLGFQSQERRAVPTVPVFVFVLTLALAAGPSPAAPRPHIVVILADDLGYSDLGSYGGEIATPNLDRLAHEGVRFTQFYATPRCSPSRAALLTGLYPHEAGLGHLNLAWGRRGYRGELEPHAVTMAEALRSAGYRTYMAGKWHLAHNPGREPDEEMRRAWPRSRGFDRFFGTLRGSGSYFEPASLMRDDDFVEPGPDFYYTDELSAEAARFVGEHFAGYPDRPLFLYLAYTAPHWPLHAPPEDVEKYNRRYDAGWDALRRARHRRMVEMGLVRRGWPLAPRDPEAPAWEEATDRAWQARRMEVYAAMVERMDRGIGRVLAALETAGAGDDTLVFFLSDNGASAEELKGISRLGAWILPIPRASRRHFGDNPGMMPGPADTFQTYGPGWSSLSNTPFRRHKRATHEGGIATPLILRWRSGLGVTPGSLIHAPGHLVDLMPTVLEVAGAVYPERFAGRETLPLRGESLMPLLRGGSRRRGPIFWEHEGNRALRDGRWKIVSDWPGRWELYDLEAGRTELRDLAASEPQRLAEMRTTYERLAAETHVGVWPWVVPQVRWLAWGVLGLVLAAVALGLRRRRHRKAQG